jgi:hypothetical protein
LSERNIEGLRGATSYFEGLVYRNLKEILPLHLPPECAEGPAYEYPFPAAEFNVLKQFVQKLDKRDET